VVVHHLLEAYSNGQTLHAAYEKLEQCCQRGNEKVFEFKIPLEELLWTLEDEPSELAKTAKFMIGLLPSLNRKLHGKEYSSLAHAVEAAQIEEWCLEVAESSHMEKTRSNMVNEGSCLGPRNCLGRILGIGKKKTKVETEANQGT